MKNKGKFISLAVCIGVLNTQMSAPYYTTIVSAQEMSIKREVDKNENRNTYELDKIKKINSESKYISGNDKDSEIDKDESNKDDKDSEIDKDESNKDDKDLEIDKDESNKDDKDLEIDKDQSNIDEKDNSIDLDVVETPTDVVNKIILQFNLEGINYSGKLPEKTSLEDLETTLKKVEDNLLDENSKGEDVFFTEFHGWYLDSEYREKLNFEDISKDTKNLNLFPRIEEIKEIEVKFHNESKLDIKLPEDISFKKSDKFEVDITDENILGFTLRDSEKIWDFEKDKVEDNLDNLEGKNTLNLYTKLDSNIKIEEELTQGGDYRLKGRLSQGENMELHIDTEKGYIVDNVQVLDSKDNLVAEGKNIEFLTFEVPSDSFTIKINFTEKADEIEEVKLEVYSNGGKFTLENSVEDIYETNIEYYSQVKILKDLEENIYRQVEIDDKFKVYTFDGWYLDELCETKFNTDSRIIEDTKLYAGWKVSETDELNIKFNSNLKDDSFIKLPGDQIFKIDDLSLVEKPEQIKFIDKYYDEYNLKSWFLKDKTGDEDKNIVWDFETDKVKDKLDFLVARNGRIYLNLYANWDIIDLFETGTEKEPFEIKSAQALVALSKKVSQGKNYKDCYFSIVENIDLSLTNEFKAIGNDKNYFSGNIKAEKVRYEEENKEEENKEEENKEEENKEDINNIESKDDYYKILGLNINTKEDYQGLFGHIRDASLENIIVEGKVRGNDNTAGLVGFVGENSRIKNSVSRVSVDGNCSVGGLIGYVEDKVKLNDLSNEGKVSGMEKVGGIVGEIGNYISASNFTNTADVEGREKVAGLIGEAGSSNKLYNLKNDGGKVSGDNYISGIVAKIGKDSTIDYAKNKGKILASQDKVAGIVGYTDGNISISNSSNKAFIKGRKEIGGILGYSDNSIKIIEKSHNTGDIESKGEEAWRSKNSHVGGIVGLIDSSQGGRSKLIRVYNTGDITGADFTAGILGSKDSNTISGINMERSYNQGNISGENYVGGIIGFLPKASKITDSYNTGRINGDLNIAGIAGATYHIKNSNVEVNSTYIRDSYNYGRISGDGKVGAILSEGYTDKNSNNFYLDTSVEEISDKVKSLTQVGKGAFISGEVAYFLDIKDDGLRKGIWSQGHAYPVFAGGENKAVYKVSLDIKGSANGKVELEKTYVNGRDSVNLKVEPALRHIVKYVELKDRKNNDYDIKVSGNSYSFKMQEEDVHILIEFMEEPTAGEYKVEFKIDGQIYEDKVVKAGKPVERPIDPTKEGLEFIGWYLNGEKYNFTRAVLKDLELEGRFQSANEVVVNFDTNIPEKEEGTKDLEPIKLKKGSKLSRPVDPVRESTNRLKTYDFKGWFTEKTDGDEWDFSNTVEENMTLYAQWEEKNDIPDGFEFKTVEELRILGDSVNTGNTHKGKTFYLANDIDLNDLGKDWEATGYHTHINAPNQQRNKKVRPGSIVFDGTLNGQGYKITLQPNQMYPFIGAIGKNGVIKNVNIYGKMAPRPDRKSFGGVAGYSYGLIENVSVKLEQEKDEISYGQTVGGIVGGNFGDIINSKVKVDMYSSHNGQVYLGGVAGVSLPGKIYDVKVLSGSKIRFKASGGWGAPMAFTGGAIGAMFGRPENEKRDYIDNVVIEKGVTIKGNGTQVGGVAGQSVGLIKNSYNGANIYVDGAAIGGISGYDGGNTKIITSINEGHITGEIGSGWVSGLGGISGGKVTEIKDSYSLGTVTSLDDGVPVGISSNTENIKNSYFFGALEGKRKNAISNINSEEIENSYYGSEDEEVSDPNYNPNMNKNDVNADLDYTGVKKASKEQFSNGEVAYYLNNINGKQREKLLWGVNPETKLPDFGGIYYVRISVDEIDGKKGEVSLIDKETGEKIDLESEKYAFIKKDHPYEVKIKVKTHEKNEEGKDLGYGFDDLKIKIGEGEDRETIDLIEKFEKDEDLIVKRDGVTEVEQSEKLGEVEKEKPIIPQEPTVPEKPEEDKPSTDRDKEGSSGSRDRDKSGSGRGDGAGLGDGTGSEEGLGDGTGLGEGLGDGSGLGQGEGSNLEKVGDSKDKIVNDDSSGGNNSKEDSNLDIAGLVDVDNEPKELDTVASVKPLEEIIDMSSSQNMDDENESETEPTEELEEESEELEELEEEVEEELEESKEESLSFIEKLVDKVKANPFIAAIVAIGFIVINMLIAFFRFKNKKDD